MQLQICDTSGDFSEALNPELSTYFKINATESPLFSENLNFPHKRSLLTNLKKICLWASEKFQRSFKI